jgi:hypothetical protein
MHTNRPVRGNESGFALILALLALLLLTFLGLTLAVTTSTELQIATNYRWSEQARYVAEAGIEAGKLMLRETVVWDNLLPAPRTATWTGAGAPVQFFTTTRTDPAGNTVRDGENWQCDNRGNGVGYGRVLDSAGVPQQYIGTFGGQNLTGAFTLWVRRPLHYLPDGNIVDWGGNLSLGAITLAPDNNNLILVAEGMAPFNSAQAMFEMSTNDAMKALVGRAKATYVMEVALSRNPPILGGCDNPLSGQQGQGPGGANNGGCEKMGAGSMDVAARGSTATNATIIENTSVR